MATTVTYNGVVLQNVLTRTFDQEAVYDESNTDKLYDRFRIVVVGMCHVQATSNTTYITPRSFSTASEQEAWIRKLLMEPRRDFAFRVGTVGGIGGVALLEASHTQGLNVNLDVNNGPRPLGCHVKHIAGSAALRVEFSIEVCKVECTSPSNYQGVLNNRWQMVDDYDAELKCTRTIRGRLRVAHINLNPQALRNWVVPPLQASFAREKMSFTTSRNGLELDYEIVDRQKYAAAPFPAVTWEGTHVESTGDGVNHFGEFHVRLTGPPLADKKLLIQTAAILAEARLQISAAAFEKGDFILEQAAIIDHLHNNSIEMRLRIRHTKDTVQYFSIVGETMGRKISDQDIPGYDALRSLSPKQSDLTTLAGLFVSYLQSPCNDHHMVPQAEGESASDVAGNEGNDYPEIESSTGELPVSYDPDYSLSHREHIYTYYTMDARYEVSTLRIQLPVAQFSNVPGSFDKTSEVIRLGLGAAQRIITIEAERADAWPEIPPMTDYVDAVGPAALIGRAEITPSVRLAKDGSRRVFAMEAVYRFALPRIPQPNEFRAPQLPWMGTENPSQAADLAVSSESFVGGLI